MIVGCHAAGSRHATLTILAGVTLLATCARQRDASLDSEDHLKIVLDPFGDGRSMPVTLRRELVFASNQLLVKAQYAFRY
jgi:hypothetical protein